MKSIKDLEVEIKSAQVTTRLQDLKHAIRETKGDMKLAQLNHEILERQYDQGLIGDYMRTKMQGLLTSDDFCGAQKSCKDGKQDPQMAKPNLSKLFFNDKGLRGDAPEGKPAAAPEAHADTPAK